jgi:hypothetical protein
MTYDATVQFKFDATFTPTYGSGFGSTVIEDYIPEEHYLITAPAADLNATQYFKLFEKFMLCVGMCPSSIRSGAMSLVFNDYVDEKEQRKVCKEYELTMDEDLEKKYQDFKQRDEEWARLKPGPMGTVDNLGRMFTQLLMRERWQSGAIKSISWGMTDGHVRLFDEFLW